jgi:transcriptional regulator of acetoin/glycerol metabolism
VEDLPPALTSSNASDLQSPNHEWNADREDASAATGLDQLERLTIQRVFEQVGGDIALASKMLGISRATVYRKLKRYQISLHPAEVKMFN